MKYQPFWLSLLFLHVVLHTFKYARTLRQHHPHPTEHIQTWVLCLKWDTLTLKSLLLPVICFSRVRNAVVHSLCLRSAFASGSLPSMEHQRIYNGTASEGVESSLRISLKSVLIFGDGLGMVFTFFIVFHAYRIRWSIQKFMLVVMLLRLSATHTSPL